VKEVDNSVNFAAGGILNHMGHRNSLSVRVSDSYVMVYEAVSHVTLLCMCKLYPAPTLVAQYKWKLLSK
jgi:hypothetical protein